MLYSLYKTTLALCNTVAVFGNAYGFESGHWLQ